MATGISSIFTLKQNQKEKLKMAEKNAEKKATPRVRILGNAFVITSKLKFENIKKMEKLSNETLCLVEIERDDTVNEVFRISTGKVASVSPYGITYNEANPDGYAIATSTFPSDVTDKKAFIKENLAKVMLMLDELEAHVADDLEKLEKRYEELDKDIEIVG